MWPAGLTAGGCDCCTADVLVFSFHCDWQSYGHVTDLLVWYRSDYYNHDRVCHWLGGRGRLPNTVCSTVWRLAINRRCIYQLLQAVHTSSFLCINIWCKAWRRARSVHVPTWTFTIISRSMSVCRANIHWVVYSTFESVSSTRLYQLLDTHI